MDPGPHKLETVKEEGWHIVSNNWWHTSYESVPWSYPYDDASENNNTTRYFRGSLFGTHGTCCDSSRHRHTTGEFPLSIDLSGVRSALDALVKYEMDVGFTPDILGPKPQVDISIAIDEEAFARSRERWELYAEVLTSGVDSTTEVAPFEEFLNRDETGSRASSPLSSHGGLHRSTSTLSSVDLTDSDISFNSSSLPSTPKKKSAETIVEVKGASPVKGDHGQYVFPPRPLNAAASCFVPSSLPSQSELASFSFAMPTGFKPSSLSSPPAIDFAFPNLEVSPLPVVQIQKDENGFYSEAEVAAPVPQTKQESCAFLPPFLQSPSRRKAPVSKTRALVDRLRSSHSHSHSPSPNPPLYDVNIFDEHVTVSEDDAQNSRTSSPEDEDDGWINLAEADKASKEVKARRTRDLFLALTRRRSDSVPPNANDNPAKNKCLETETTTTTPPSSSSPPLSSLHDGWIDPTASVTTEVPSQRQTESRSRNRKRRSSHAPTAPPNSASSHFIPAANARATSTVPHASFPTATQSFSSTSSASYFYPTYPAMMTPVTYTSYMQQLQLMQLQLRSGSGGSGGRRTTSTPSTQEWFQYPTAGAPYTTANSPAPVATSPTRAARRDSFW